jgi:predicted MFS family arabinose efflux permease
MKESKKILFIYTAFQFFYSLLVWIPIFYEYQKQIGMSDVEIFHIQSIYYLVFCFLEIPTGYLADRVGYKKCLFSGAGTLILANLIPVFFQNYSGLLWHFLLIALSRSFVSGASSAYLYELLQQKKIQHEYAKIEGKARSVSLLGKVFCWAIVGVLMKWHLTLPYLFTSLNALLSLIFVFFLPEISPQKINPQNSLKQTFLALKNIRQDFYLIFIIFQGIGLFTLTRLCQVNLYQPILDSKSFSLYAFGWVMSLMTLSEAIGSYVPHFFQRFAHNRRIVSLTTTVMGMSLFLIPFCEKSGTFFLLVIFSLASGIAFPIQKQLINDALKESNQFRATLLSVESIIDRAVCAWMASLIGISLKEGKLNDFLIQAGILTCLGIIALSSILYFLHMNDDKNKNFQLISNGKAGTST